VFELAIAIFRLRLLFRFQQNVATLATVRNTALAIGFATAVAIGLSVWLVGGRGNGEMAAVASEFILIGFAMFAFVCAVLAARATRGRRRIAWICQAVGLAGWAAGEMLWTYFDLVLNTDPFPSVADAAYLLYPVGACAALVLYCGGYSRPGRGRMVLDALIVAGSLFEIFWVLVLRDIYEAGAESRFEMGLSLAYPVSDIVVVTVAVLVLGRARPGSRVTLGVLTLGNVLNAMSDSVWVYLDANNAYVNGHLVDVGWIFGLLALGSAALLSRRSLHADDLKPHVPSRTSSWLPYLPIGLAGAVCAPTVIRAPGMTPLLASAMVLISAVLARQFLMVGENRRLLAMVADQALRDPLTGLANRALFHDRLTHAMQLHERDNQSVTVLSLDLDDFKLVNDSLGHPAGDALLRMVGERILGCVRSSDTVARLGGDEYAVLMEGTAEQSRLIAHRVVQEFTKSFALDGNELIIRPSVGLAIVTAADLTTSADVMLKHADMAMYSAKRSRTGDVHTFTPDIVSGERGPLGLRLLAQLRHAISNVDLTLVYQPKFELRSGEIVGVEALLRWPHPERGLLGPDQFLPLVRKHGLMHSVTDLVLARALDDAAVWYSKGVGVPVAVNLFAPSLADLNLPRRMVQALEERGLSSNALTVEITEYLLLDNMNRARTVLTRLRECGIRVAIDDFGRGYSALWYLRELPIDEVKLDKGFIAPILVDRKAAAIVRAVINLAHELDVTTVAEGVEDEKTATRLREYGCEVAQGFHCSMPLEASVLLETLLSGQVMCCDAADGSQPIQLPRTTRTNGATETDPAPASLATGRVAR
jgi:diguanylate cyclase (GGDEF)-like protein